jgi:hypothetical protein
MRLVREFDTPQAFDQWSGSIDWNAEYPPEVWVGFVHTSSGEWLPNIRVVVEYVKAEGAD